MDMRRKTLPCHETRCVNDFSVDHETREQTSASLKDIETIWRKCLVEEKRFEFTKKLRLRYRARGRIDLF
jgi:uncharacterized Zn finger protein